MVIVFSLALGLAGGASGASTPAVDFELGFTSTQSHTPTALTLHILYRNPSNPNGKPPGLASVTIAAPPGSVFDATAVPACHASDTTLMSQGPAACPAASKVGSGTLTAITGFGPPVDPVLTDATLFNSGDGIIELFTYPNTGVALAIDRSTYSGHSTLVAHPPATPGGPPDGRTTVREVKLTYNPVRGPAGKPFITTPPQCPATGVWTSKLTFTTSNGAAYSAQSTTPCATQPMPFSCAPASGRLARRSLGPLTLGTTRAHARSLFRRYSTRGRRHMDFFCLAGHGIRAGYPSGKLLRSLSPQARKRVRGRVILALTANRRYALRGVRPGAKLHAVDKRLHLGPGFKGGRNTWYLIPGRVANGLLKINHGVIEEIGIANKRLTSNRRAASRFLTSFR